MVVGAGPVGLLLALELKLAGVQVIVLERLAAPSQVLKAGGIGALGLEALRRRGMSELIDAAQMRVFGAMGGTAKSDAADATVDEGRDGPKYCGHFGGLLLIRGDAQAEPDRAGAPIDQQVIEAMLNERVASLGIEVSRACEVAKLTENNNSVRVSWQSAGREGTIDCSYVVGCDGGRSTVRKLASIAFPGTDPTLTMYQGLIELDRPDRLPASGFQYRTGGMFMQFAGRLAMVDFSGPPADRHAPITHQELETVLRRITGEDVRIKRFENAARWTDTTRLVETYRSNRVLVAGDAAHIHSPFGGQGLSLGLVDAANLGWKLGAVIRGEMSETRLDTYTAERRPVAKAVLANTLAQTAIMRPDPQSAAIRKIVADLLDFDDANRFIGGMMSGLAVRYDLGAANPMVGSLVGDMPVNGGSLYQLMLDGKGVLLDASDGAAATQMVCQATTLFRCVSHTGQSMLIRPDACVAWAEEGGGIDGLEDVLHTWFG